LTTPRRSRSEDYAELEGLAVLNPGLDKQLGLDPTAHRIRPLPPLPPKPSPPPPPQPSPPPPQPQPQPQPPIMAAQANGNQIALLPTFGGEAGADVDMWIALFLRIALQFNWIDTVITANQDTRLASVAKNKLIGKAAFWLDTERRGGSKTDLWETIHANPNADPVIPITRVGLKDGLIAMFKADISQLEATEAVMDLVMKSSETINMFYVWVKWAMEVKNHSISMEDKALARTSRIETGNFSPSSWRDYPLSTRNLPCLGKTQLQIRLLSGNVVPSWRLCNLGPNA
jgi:hypothetical protein